MTRPTPKRTRLRSNMVRWVNPDDPMELKGKKARGRAVSGWLARSYLPAHDPRRRAANDFIRARIGEAKKHRPAKRKLRQTLIKVKSFFRNGKKVKGYSYRRSN